MLMSPFIVALGFAALPALGNFLGGLLSETARASDRTLSFALHLAAGIVLAVVGLELVARGLESAVPAWMLVMALIGGGLFAVFLDLLLAHIRYRFGRGGEGTGPWMIYVGVAADLFSDGIMIGAGAAVATSLALLLALGQVVGDCRRGLPRAPISGVSGSAYPPVTDRGFVCAADFFRRLHNLTATVLDRSSRLHIVCSDSMPAGAAWSCDPLSTALTNLLFARGALRAGGECTEHVLCGRKVKPPLQERQQQ